MSSRLQANPIFKQYGRLHKEDLMKEAAENKSSEEHSDYAADGAAAAGGAAASAGSNGVTSAKLNDSGNGIDDDDENDFENVGAEINRIKQEQSSKLSPSVEAAAASKAAVSRPAISKLKAPPKTVTSVPPTHDVDEFPDLEGCAPQLMSSSMTTVENASAVPPSRRLLPPGGAVSTARIKEELNEGNISVSSSSEGEDEDEGEGDMGDAAAPNAEQEEEEEQSESAQQEGERRRQQSQASTKAPGDRPPSRCNNPSSPLGNDDDHSECIMAHPSSAAPRFMKDPTVSAFDAAAGAGGEEPLEADTQTKDDLITDASDVLSSFQFREKGMDKRDRRKTGVPNVAPKQEHVQEEEEEEDAWDAANAKVDETVKKKKSDITMQQIYPISFWEAVILLKRDTKSYQEYLPQPWMKRDPGTRPLPLRSPPELTVYEKKKSIFSVFGCCGKSSSNDVASGKSPGAKAAASHTQPTPATTKDDDKEPKAPPNIAHDADFVEAMKKAPFDHKNLTHRRIIFTIYHTLTSTPGGAFAPSTDIITPWWRRREARKGATTVLYTETTNVDAEAGTESATTRHGTKPKDAPLPTDNIDWDRIGFQGTNPATDLRDSGLVALLTTLFLIDYYPLLMQKVWALCHPQQPPTTTTTTTAAAATESKSKREKDKEDLSRLPFVLIIFNFTAATLDALNLGMLRKAITRYDCDLVKDTPSSPVLVQSVVDLESEKTAASLSKIQAPVEALSTPAYCKPTPAEQRLRQRAPVLFTCCEYVVGILCLFWESWLKRQRQKRPALLTVADFGTEKALLRQRVAVSGKENGVFVATAKSRYGAVLNSFEDQMNTV